MRPPEIKFVCFHKSERAEFFTIHFDQKEVGTLLIHDRPDFYNSLNFRNNCEFGIEKLSRITNAIFCRFGAINFKIGSN